MNADLIRNLFSAAWACGFDYTLVDNRNDLSVAIDFLHGQ